MSDMEDSDKTLSSVSWFWIVIFGIGICGSFYVGMTELDSIFGGFLGVFIFWAFTYRMMAFVMGTSKRDINEDDNTLE